MSGVDQMKIPGNTVKSVEERNIPWSQQVDEASYENLSSPTQDEVSAANENSMQFQYPPFNFKENCSTPWSNMNKGRKINANHGMYNCIAPTTSSSNSNNSTPSAFIRSR